MRMRRSLGLMVLPLIRAETSKPNTGDQLQGFTFGYTTSNLVLPVISTCPTPLTISALNPTNAGGPDPIAPYTMVMFVHEQLMDGAGIAYERIYSRSMNVGDMSQSRQFQHPWMSGTQFIGCIWSQNGVSGGCQVSIISTSRLKAVVLMRRLDSGPDNGRAQLGNGSGIRQRYFGMQNDRRHGILGHKLESDTRRVARRDLWHDFTECLAPVV
jgi:hypothetical protein